MVYQLRNGTDGRPVARGLDYNAATAFFARIRGANPDSCYGLEPEELTCQSWWEIRHEKNGSCVHAWGDDAECDVWLDYLDLQDPPDCGGWSSRELGLREAFELDLEKPSDGLDLQAAIARIQPELLRHLRQLLAEVSVLAAPSLFPFRPAMLSMLSDPLSNSARGSNMPV